MSKTRIKKDDGATINEANVIKDEGIFKFLNGDEYNGRYAAYKDTINLIMEGEGVYSTEDEHIYGGIWENNELKFVNKIQYPDESVFSGQLENMKVQGTGIYKFKEGIEVEGNFINNKLSGNIMLKDFNNHKWAQERTENERAVILQPVNVFWESILSRESEVLNLGEGEESEGSGMIFGE